MALAVRGESELAKSIADQYFFASRWSKYTAPAKASLAIKPAGSVDPAIAAADRAG
jgi:hypothetical protein